MSNFFIFSPNHRKSFPQWRKKRPLNQILNIKLLSDRQCLVVELRR